MNAILIAAPLTARTVPADGLTFTARHPRGGSTATTRCPTVADRLAARGWAVTIDSRPEGPALVCVYCGGEHR